MRKLWSWAGAATMLAVAAGALAVPARFEDPLRVPAQITPLSQHSSVFAVGAAGGGFIAVGPRGHILRRNAEASDWTQLNVPVSSDLVAVSFPTQKQGWSVGHDGIVLSSEDGGTSWRRRLDGNEAYKLQLAWYEGLAAKGDAAAPRQAKFLKQMEGRANAWPFLDVWFSNDSEGWLVGAFGTILHTVDSGKSWTPMTVSADNPKRLHLYSVRGGEAGEVYIAGEQGLVLRLNRVTGHFDAIETPYKGTFFGVAVDGRRLVVYGLSGHAFLSDDAGATWQQLGSGTSQSIVGHAQRPDGALLFVTQDGKILLLAKGANQLVTAGRAIAGEVFGIAASGNDGAVLATATGPKPVRLARGQ